MCKCCQLCLESIYWRCCEERFCYDESIAKYSDDEWERDEAKCYSNSSMSVDSLGPITDQPGRHRAVLAELPIIAPDIYQVFSKSMIFQQEADQVDAVPRKAPLGRVVSFEDEKENKQSDFEVGFHDELHADHKMFKIDEEEEDESKPATPDVGIVMKTPERKVLPRTDSTRSFTKSHKSLKNASNLSLPELIKDSKHHTQVFTIRLDDDDHSIGKMPDTPVIIGGRLPKFFVETPVIGEYRAEASLQSMVGSPSAIFPESDYSMPRYYGRGRTIAQLQPPPPRPLNPSKSMPDLHRAPSDVSKRLTRLGSRLKPLIIRKHSDDALHK